VKTAAKNVHNTREGGRRNSFAVQEAPATYTLSKRVRIGDALKLINGRAFKPSEWSQQGLPIVRIQNLNDSDAPFNYYDGELPAKFGLKKGDLLFAWSGTPGTSFGAHIWRGDDAWLNQHIFKVLFDETQFDKRFLRYAINQNLSQYIAAAHGGAGLAHITKGKFEASMIICPLLDEQKRIVAEIEKQFSRLDEAVANLKRVKAGLKGYKASILKAAVEGHLVPIEAELARREGRSYETSAQLLQRILETRRNQWKHKGKYETPAEPDITDLPELPDGWVWASLDQIAWDSGYGTSEKCLYENTGPAVLRIPNVQNEALDLQDLKFAPAEFGMSSTDAVKEGDMLVIRTNGSKSLIGRAAVVLRKPEKVMSFASYLIRFRLMQIERVPAWVSIIWQTGRTRSWIESRAAKSAGQHNISMSVLSTAAIPLPPVAEQHRIVAEVDRRLSLVRGVETEVETNLKRAERLRQSVLKQAFQCAEAVPVHGADPVEVVRA